MTSQENQENECSERELLNVFPIGDAKTAGSNIATEIVKVGTSSVLRFYRVDGAADAQGNIIPNSVYVANLTTSTIEIEVDKDGKLKLRRLSGQQHFKNCPKPFQVSEGFDLKISRNFPTNSGFWVVGAEDSRPYTSRIVLRVDINPSETSPRKLRVTYEPVNSTSGVVKVSVENTNVLEDKISCEASSTGVPNRGWSVNYRKSCV